MQKQLLIATMMSICLAGMSATEVLADANAAAPAIPTPGQQMMSPAAGGQASAGQAHGSTAPSTSVQAAALAPGASPLIPPVSHTKPTSGPNSVALISPASQGTASSTPASNAAAAPQAPAASH